MKLSSLLDSDAIKILAPSLDGEGIIRELVAITSRSREEADIIFDKIMEQERELPSALGNGIFFPHARIDALADFHISIGVSRDGIDIGAADGKPINFAFLIACPFEKNTLMLKTRSALLRLFLDPDASARLLAARDTEEICEIIENSGIRIEEELLVRDIMNTEPITTTKNATLEEIVRLMYSDGVDTIPVLDENGHFLGIVSGYGILRLAIPEYLDNIASLSFLRTDEPLHRIFKKRKEIRAADIMSVDAAQISPDAPIMDAAFLMVRKKVRYVYVVENNKILGVISRRMLISRIMVE